MRYSGPLATEEQINAERLALRIYASSKLEALRPRLRKILEEDPAGKIADGAQQIDRVLEFWTMAHIMWQIGGDTFRPEILWHVDNTRHRWFGHEMLGMGAAGDNPDHIYRGAFLDGSYSYEISARIGENRPAQVSFELFHGEPGKTILSKQTSATPDLGNQVSMLKSDDMKIDADGRFIVTIGPEPSIAPNHLRTVTGPLQLAVRDVLSDWKQTPTQVTIRRISGPASPPPRNEEQLTERILADLPDFVRFWSGFKTNWMGGIADNETAGPAPRAGGWGYLLGGRFSLLDDQAIVLTIRDAGASYIGFQVLSPWFMMPSDARSRTLSLNQAQVLRNPDGTVTYVLALKDPGVANWIDTAGLHQGMYVVRWQGVPKGADVGAMTKDFKVIDLADLASAIPPHVPRLNTAERAQQIARRHREFDHRFGEPIDD
jgi:hypothetical protein